MCVHLLLNPELCKDGTTRVSINFGQYELQQSEDFQEFITKSGDRIFQILP
jgi:hypothetical protein